MLIFCIINIYRIKYTELFGSIMKKIKTKLITKETSFIYYCKLKESLLKNNIIYEKDFYFFRSILLILIICYTKQM